MRSEPPRYYVIVYLDGGIDPVLTINPTKRDAVASNVDVPYAPEQIVQTGGVPLGPDFAPLAPWAKRMAVVNGVHLDTANHNTGWSQISRLRTRCAGSMPTILDIIGRHGTQPLASISFGGLSPVQYSPGYADGHGVFAIHDAGKERLQQVATTLYGEADGLAAAGADPRLRRTAENYRSIGRLAEKLQDTPTFKPESWPSPSKQDTIATDFQRILWVLEHDLARCCFIKVRPYGGWDSHNHNILRQRNTSRAFTEVFAKFMTELELRKNAHGTLAEQTTIVAGSEIGRFPQLNGNEGKDHFPEASYAMWGPNLKTNGSVYGALDNRLAALPDELESGKQATKGGHKIRLDDLGATLLKSAGIDPAPYGYTGRVLPFLLPDAAKARA